MRVNIEIAGFLKRPGGGARKCDLELPEGATAGALLADLGYSDEERRVIRVSRAGNVLLDHEPLRPGDSLLIFTALGGG